MQTMKECVLAAYRREKQDFVPCVQAVMHGVMCPGDNYIGPAGEGFDAWGVKWHFDGGNPAFNGPTPVPGGALIEDFEDWETHIKLPDLDALPWGFARQMLPADRQDKLVDVFMLSGLLERMHYLAGFENALCAFYEAPEAVHSFLHAMADWRIAFIDRLVAIAQPEIVHMQDDWGTQNGMMISPELWREFFKPHEKRFAQHIHSKGLLYEHHSCGYIQPIIGDLVEIGVDAINPLNVCNDIPQIKKEFGNAICLIGGLNNQLIDAPETQEAEIRAEVRRAIDENAPGGAYIPSYIPTRPDRLEIVTDEILRYGGAYRY